MKCFKIEPKCSFTGGCAIIAANDIKEAVEIFCKDEYNNYIYDMNGCVCNIVEGLEYNTNVPSIVFNTIYIE